MSANFRLEPTVCPLCGAVDHTVLREAPDRLGVSDQQFRLVRCRACTLVYQNPRVAPDTIGVFYPETYAHYQVTTPAQRRRGGAQPFRKVGELGGFTGGGSIFRRRGRGCELEGCASPRIVETIHPWRGGGG